MKQKKYKRCFKHRIITENGIIYTCRFNINHSLISVYPEIDPRLMSMYRGTTPAALWDLAADLNGYVEEPN